MYVHCVHVGMCMCGSIHVWMEVCTRHAYPTESIERALTVLIASGRDIVLSEVVLGYSAFWLWKC